MTTIRHALNLTAPTSKLHNALTTEAGLRAWWCKTAKCTNDQVELSFRKDEMDVKMKFRVDANSAERVAWTCLENGNPVWVGTTLVWSLSSKGEATELVFEHAGFEEDGSPPYTMTVQGWEHFVESLRSYAEGGSGSPS